jgi:hypothetical protein
MSQLVLNQVLTQISMLDRDELLRVDQAVRERLDTPSDAAKIHAFHRALLASGLVREIKEPIVEEGLEWEPVLLEGNPVSQSIIDERR